MKRLIVTFTILLTLIAVPVLALELGDNVDLDAVAKYKYVVDDIGKEGVNPVRIFADIQPNYLFNGEVGLKIADTVRISGNYDYVEYFEERYGGGIEVYLPKVKYIDAGVVADVTWINDNLSNTESDPIYTVGLVFRLD